MRRVQEETEQTICGLFAVKLLTVLCLQNYTLKPQLQESDY